MTMTTARSMALGGSIAAYEMLMASHKARKLEMKRDWIARDQQVENFNLLKIGLTRLRSQADGCQLAVKAAHDAVLEAIAPIAMHVIEELADNLRSSEIEAQRPRARLDGFSRTYVGATPQKLGPQALRMLRNGVMNSTAPQINSAMWKGVQQDRHDFIAWRTNLETDANATFGG